MITKVCLLFRPRVSRLFGSAIVKRDNNDKLKQMLTPLKEKESDIDNADLSRFIVGPGTADPSKIPTDLEMSAGYERIQLLCELEGRDFFDFAPLLITHRGYPPESHDVVWLQIDKDHEIDRCIECGCVFKHRAVEQPPLPLGARLGEPIPQPHDYLD